MFGNAADAPTIMLLQIEPWLPAENRREYDAVGFFPSGHPLDDYATVLKRCGCRPGRNSRRAVKTGATGKVAATVVSRMERRTKTGNKMGIMGLSDPTGHFEAVLFSEGLAQYRVTCWSRGCRVAAARRRTAGRGRGRACWPPSRWMPRQNPKGLRIFVRDTKPLILIARRLNMPEAAAPNGSAKARRPSSRPRHRAAPMAMSRSSSCSTSRPRWR